MISEITIKISFAGEVKEVSAGAKDTNLGEIQIPPPEEPKEIGAENRLTDPPTLEDTLGVTSEAGIIPPPPSVNVEQ